MSKYLNLLGAATVAVAASSASAGEYGLGRPALPEEIAAWNLDVSPDGSGLPPGSGSVEDGEMLFSDNCASCHGEFAEGVDNWPKLAGGEDTLARKDPVKTVGSYWPHLSTTWDYVHRSMPFGAAQTLSTDDVYAITAYILFSNYLVDDDFVLTNENFLEVEMPNSDGFIVDDRETAEAHFWAEPCLEDCKDNVEITMHATVLDVTPGTAEATEADATVTAAAEPEADVQASAVPQPAASEMATGEGADPAMLAAGEKAFAKCKACHQIGEGAENKTGPHLNNVLGRTAGSLEGFRYSKPMEAAGEDGVTWTAETLDTFLRNPKKFIKGTKMAFAGFKKDDDIKAITVYLASFGN